MRWVAERQVFVIRRKRTREFWSHNHTYQNDMSRVWLFASRESARNAYRRYSQWGLSRKDSVIEAMEVSATLQVRAKFGNSYELPEHEEAT